MAFVFIRHHLSCLSVSPADWLLTRVLCPSWEGVDYLALSFITVHNCHLSKCFTVLSNKWWIFINVSVFTSFPVSSHRCYSANCVLFSGTNFLQTIWSFLVLNTYFLNWRQPMPFVNTMLINTEVVFVNSLAIIGLIKTICSFLFNMFVSLVTSMAYGCCEEWSVNRCITLCYFSKTTKKAIL